MIVDDIIRDGEATLDGVTLEPVHPTAGYAVAIHSGTAVKVTAFDEYGTFHAPLASAVRAVRDTFRPPFVGVWIDDHGTAHVDPVVILPDRESAEIVGRAFGQESIYGFGRSGYEPGAEAEGVIVL